MPAEKRASSDASSSFPRGRSENLGGPMSMVGFSPRVSVLRNAKNSVWLLAAIFALFFVCPPLFSQTSQGTIQGAVFDQSGGAIAGATVTVTDVARGVARTLTTDSAGAVRSHEPESRHVLRCAPRPKASRWSSTAACWWRSVKTFAWIWLCSPASKPRRLRLPRKSRRSIPPTRPWAGPSATSRSTQLPLNGRNFQRLLRTAPRSHSRRWGRHGQRR